MSVSHPSPLGVNFVIPSNPLREGRQFPSRRGVSHPPPVDEPRRRRRVPRRAPQFVEDPDLSGSPSEQASEPSPSIPSQRTSSVGFVEVPVVDELQRPYVDSRPSVERRDTGRQTREAASSSSGGQHPGRLSSADRRWIQESIRESVREGEDRAVRRIERSIEDKFIPKIKKWFENLLEKTRCGCTHRDDTATHAPHVPRHPTTTTRGEDQETTSPPSPDVPRDSGHIEPAEAALHQPSDTPPRYSHQIHGTSPGTTSHHSMMGLDLFSDLTPQDVVRQTFEPVQQQLEQQVTIKSHIWQFIVFHYICYVFHFTATHMLKCL